MKTKDRRRRFLPTLRRRARLVEPTEYEAPPGSSPRRSQKEVEKFIFPKDYCRNFQQIPTGLTDEFDGLMGVDNRLRNGLQILRRLTLPMLFNTKLWRQQLEAGELCSDPAKLCADGCGPEVQIHTGLMQY